MADGLIAEGTKVDIGQGNAVSVAYASDTFVEIGEVVDFDGPGGEAAVIDRTHLRSTRREKRMGLPDEGQLTLSINWVPGNAGQEEAREARAARQARWIRMTYEDGTIDRFTAFVLGFSKGGGVDGGIQGSITLEITGEVTQVEAA